MRAPRELYPLHHVIITSSNQCGTNYLILKTIVANSSQETFKDQLWKLMLAKMITSIKSSCHFTKSSVCISPPQAISVQAGFWLLGFAVRGSTGLPPDVWDRVLPSAAATPSQQRDQTTVYLQQASPLLQLEVHSPVCITAHAHPGPAAHIRHRWVLQNISCYIYVPNFQCFWSWVRRSCQGSGWLIQEGINKHPETQLCLDTNKMLQASKGTGTKKRKLKRKRRSIWIKVVPLKSRRVCFEGVGF